VPRCQGVSSRAGQAIYQVVRGLVRQIPARFGREADDADKKFTDCDVNLINETFYESNCTFLKFGSQTEI
jgi:hypothetical protein